MLGFYKNVKHLFCAIFVYCTVFLSTGVAYAVCDLVSVDDYRTVSSYYCSAAGADPTVRSTSSYTTCVMCKDGYEPSVNGEYTDYECGASACTGVGTPDQSKCASKIKTSYGCSPRGGGSALYPEMRINYICDSSGSTTLSVKCIANDNCYLGCVDHTRPCEPEHVCSKTGHVLTGWLLSDDMGPQFQGVYPAFENLTGAQYAYGEEATFSVSADARWEQAICTATNGTCGPVSVDEYNTPYATITCNAGYSRDGGTDTTSSFDAYGTAGVASMTATCKARSITVEPGYYLPKGSLTQAECPKTTTSGGTSVGAYCTGGTFAYSTTADQGITACPVFNSTTRATSYPSVTGFSLSYSSGQATGWYTGQSSISQCLATYTLTNEAGTVEWGGVKYNTSTGKYDISRYANVADGFFYKKLNPGYYFTERYTSTYCNTTTNRMYYKTAAKCTAGYYCPGYTSMPLCSSGTYNTEMGRFICTGATYSAAGASKCTSCPGDYTYSTSNGKTSVSSCQIQCPAGTMIAERYGNCTSPSGGWWAPGARVASYGNFVAIDYCMAGYTSSGTTASAHDAASDCTKVVSNASVSTTIPARYIRLKSSGNSVNSGTHVVEIQAFASVDGTGTNLLSGKTGSTGDGNATDGSLANNTYSMANANNYITWDMGATKNIGSLKFAMYSADNRTYNNVQIEVSTNNSTWTTVFGPRNVSSPKADATNSKLEYVKLAGQTACATGYSSPSTTVSLGSTISCSAIDYTIKYYDGDTELTNLTPKNYKITWDTFSLPTLTDKNGYTFGGWFTSSDFSGTAVTKIAKGSTGNKVFYAKWTKKSFTCTAGTYLPKGETTCSICPKTTMNSGSTVGAYCVGGTFSFSETNDQGITACPVFNASTRTSSFPSTTGFVLSYLSGAATAWYTGQTSITQCLANYYFTNEAGSVQWEGVKYNTLTGKYDDGAGGIYYTQLNPGYYLTDRYDNAYCDTSADVRKKLYKTATKCTAGYKCPGYTTIPLCSSTAETYGVEMGRFICTGATYSEAGASVCTSCPGDYTYNTSNGKTSVSSCQIQCASGTMIASKHENCTSPAGGWYAMSSRVASYGNTVPVNYCMSGYTNTGTDASNHDEKTDCVKTISDMSVSNTIPARYIRLKSAGNTVNNGTHVVEIKAFTSQNGSGTNLLSGKGGTTGGSLTNATDGSLVQNTYSTAAANDYLTWDMGATYDIGVIKFAMYSADNRTYKDVQIEVSSNGSGWTTVLGPRNISTPKADDTNAKEEYLFLAGESSCSTGYESDVSTVKLGETVSCEIGIYAVNLDSKFYSSSTLSGVTVDKNAAPTTIYVKYNTGWYSNSGATTAFSQLTTLPAYNGYTFGGFYTGRAGAGTQIIDASGKIVSGRLTTLSANSTLYAKWTPNTITLDYNENGGDAISNSSCTYGSSFTLPAAATKDGSVFAGWKLKDGSVKSAGTSVACDYTNLGVYNGTSSAITAQWTLCAAGNYCPGDNTEKSCPTNSSSAAGASSCTCNTGYNYNGGATTTTNTCTAIGYTISYNLNGGTNPTTGVSTSYTIESADITLPTPTKNGYTFGGWYTSSDFSDTAVTKIAKGSTGNKTFYAKWNNCGVGYWCENGVKTACTTYGANYTTDGANATKNTDCYQPCVKACTQQTCPANGTCTHGATSTSGKQYYGSLCNASASTCDIAISCSAKYYLSGNSCATCTAGKYCSGDNTEKQCTGRTKYSAAGASSCSTVSGGYYTTGCNSSGNGCTGQSQCTSGTYCESGEMKNCPSDDNRTVASANGSVAAASCYVTCASSIEILNGTTSVVSSTINYNGSTYPACTYSASCNDGYEVSGNGTTAPVCTACAIGSYGGGNTVACSVCPNGGTTASVATTAITSCYKTGLPYEATRGDGTQRCFYTSGDGDSAEYSTDCDSIQITSCDAKYYLKTATATNCTSAGTGYYSAAGSLTRTQCPANYRSGAAASSQSGCKTKCADGAYVATAKAACVNVGSGYYAATHTVAYGKTSSVRGQCAAGLTTIGYGAGANEEGDCGRVLNVDGEKLYLRSTKKTEHALHVRVGEDVFYGNMDTISKVISEGATNKLRIRYNDTVYYVYDDSVN